MAAPKRVYRVAAGQPIMRRSFVCYADILGYSNLASTALKTGKGLEFLRRIRSALSKSYKRLRRHAKGMPNDDAFYSIKVFTDNVVVGYPVDDYGKDFGEPQLGDIMGMFSELQAVLSMEGFFLRGGIALGEHYMDNDIVFGDALLEAVGLDKGGGPPRLALAPSAVNAMRRHLGFYREGYAPHYDMLLEDADGTIFLNYLDEAFGAFPDGGIFFDLIEEHQRQVSAGLEKYRGIADVRAKFEWAARYHNFVCRDFAESHPLPSFAEDYDEDAMAAEEAQRLLDYIIDIESLAASPSRMTVEPIELHRPIKRPTDG